MSSGQWKWTDSTEFIYTNWRDGKTPTSGSKFEKKDINNIFYHQKLEKRDI